MNQMIKFEKRDGVVIEMSIDEYTRWMCLAEAFYFIEEKAKDLKIDIGNLLKPLAIDVYIKERFPSMRHDVECEHELGNL